MSDAEAERPRGPRRLVWAAVVVAGAALFVRVACYRRVVLESCTACLRESPSRCAASTDDADLARRTGFDAREDAREQLSCGAIRDATCTLRPIEDFVFTCHTKEVDLPPNGGAPFERLGPR
ncbi:MAG TPA: hypothetical protein VI456_03975 [Polyangia bacterium]